MTRAILTYLLVAGGIILGGCHSAPQVISKPADVTAPTQVISDGSAEILKHTRVIAEQVESGRKAAPDLSQWVHIDVHNNLIRVVLDKFNQAAEALLKAQAQFEATNAKHEARIKELEAQIESAAQEAKKAERDIWLTLIGAGAFLFVVGGLLAVLLKQARMGGSLMLLAALMVGYGQFNLSGGWVVTAVMVGAMVIGGGVLVGLKVWRETRKDKADWKSLAGLSRAVHEAKSKPEELFAAMRRTWPQFDEAWKATKGA